MWSKLIRSTQSYMRQFRFAEINGLKRGRRAYSGTQVAIRAARRSVAVRDKHSTCVIRSSGAKR